MRYRYLLSAILFVTFSTFMFGQWTVQTSGTTQTLYSMDAVNANVIWACGNAGTVVRTVNGGAAWVVKTPTNASFRNYAIEAIDSATAYVAATNQSSSLDFRIFKTTDGGTTWTQQYANAASFSDAIKFWDANNGIAYGDPDNNYFPILRTSDGGATWTRLDSASIPAPDLTNGEFGSSNNMDILGDNVWFGSASDATGFVPRMFKSTNKGLTWQAYPVTGLTGYIMSVTFRDALHGFCVGLNGNGAKTTDGGLTWTKVDIDLTIALRWIKYVPGTNMLLTSGGVSGSGKTYYSLNDGATWTLLASHTLRHRALGVVSGNTFWACGDNGHILKWSGSALPVELSTFSAAQNGKDVLLKWTTASEKNNRSFDIQRKSANGSWVTIGSISGAGTSTSSKEYSFIDKINGTISGSVVYRLRQNDYDGSFTLSHETEVDYKAYDFALLQNYPNPFNPTTMISYTLANESPVSLKLFSVTGEEIATLVNSVQPAGIHSINFDASKLSSGLYIYQLKAGSNLFTRKMSVVK